MQKRPNIRWRKSDIEKLEKVVKRFNSKVNYNIKKDPNKKEILPDKMKKADFMDNVKTRQDFNREIKSLQRFLKRGAEKPITSKTGNTITKWEKKEIGIKVATINRERTRERNRLENTDVTSQGKPTGLKRGEMGSERMQALQPKKFNFDKIKKGKEWEKFKSGTEKQISSLYKQQQMDEYKLNYIKGIYRVFGESGEYIARLIKELPSERVTELYYREQEASIDFQYDPQALQVKLEIIESIWTKEFNQINTEVVDNWSVEQETKLNKWLDGE